MYYSYAYIPSSNTHPVSPFLFSSSFSPTPPFHSYLLRLMTSVRIFQTCLVNLRSVKLSQAKPISLYESSLNLYLLKSSKIIYCKILTIIGEEHYISPLQLSILLDGTNNLEGRDRELVSRMRQEIGTDPGCISGINPKHCRSISCC